MLEVVTGYLQNRYGIEVDDLVSAELALVPAMPPRDVGLDRALMAIYGQDDKLSSYTALAAEFGIYAEANPSATLRSLPPRGAYQVPARRCGACLWRGGGNGCHPPPLVRPEDEPVKAGLADDDDLLRAARGMYQIHTSFMIFISSLQLLRSFFRVRQAYAI